MFCICCIKIRLLARIDLANLFFSISSSSYHVTKVLELDTCGIPKQKVYGFGVLPLRWILMAPKFLSYTWTLKDLRVLENQMYMMIEGKSVQQMVDEALQWVPNNND